MEFYIITIGMLCMVIILGFILIYQVIQRTKKESVLEKTIEQQKAHINALQNTNFRLRRMSRQERRNIN